MAEQEEIEAATAVHEKEATSNPTEKTHMILNIFQGGSIEIQEIFLGSGGRKWSKIEDPIFRRFGIQKGRQKGQKWSQKGSQIPEKSSQK